MKFVPEKYPKRNPCIAHIFVHMKLHRQIVRDKERTPNLLDDDKICLYANEINKLNNNLQSIMFVLCQFLQLCDWPYQNKLSRWDSRNIFLKKRTIRPKMPPYVYLMNSKTREVWVLHDCDHSTSSFFKNLYGNE